MYKIKQSKNDLSNLSPEEKKKALRQLAIAAENAKAFRIKHPSIDAAITEQSANFMHDRARRGCLVLVENFKESCDD